MMEIRASAFGLRRLQRQRPGGSQLLIERGPARLGVNAANKSSDVSNFDQAFMGLSFFSPLIGGSRRRAGAPGYFREWQTYE
jgi:hypothetical protein